MKHDPIMSTRPVRAFVLFRSGGWLDLINPRFRLLDGRGPSRMGLARISR